MSFQMLKTELHKIYSKKVIWISLALFIALFFLLKIQMIDKVGVKYTLEPVKEELTEVIKNDNLYETIKLNNYNMTTEELISYMPQEVINYLEQYKGTERIYSSLTADLRSSIFNYYQKVDGRKDFIKDLEKQIAVSKGNDKKAKEKVLEEYKNSNVNIELNLESSANNFIDINHSILFPCLIILIVILGLSGIYSDEYTNNTESILLTAKKGRTGVFVSKLIASLIYVGSIVIIMELSFMLITQICYHGQNFEMSAASVSGLYLTNYEGSVFGFYIRQILGTLLSAFVIGSIVMAISSYSKNSLIPFLGAGLFYGGTALYANITVFPKFLSTLMSLPGELSLFMLQTQFELVEVSHYTSIFGILIPTIKVNIIFNIFLMLVCLFICYRGYVKKQVTN